MYGKEEPILRMADFLELIGVFLIGASVLVLLISFSDAFSDPSNSTIDWVVKFYESTTALEFFFQGGVLLAMGCITLGVGRILRVLESRNT